MATAIALRFRVNKNTAATIQSHRFINSFSSSSSTSSSPKIEDENTTQSPPSQFSNHAYISDLKSRLKPQPPPQQQQHQTRSPFSSRLSTEKPNSSDNMSKIIDTLSVFRKRSAAPPPDGISFEEVYKRNVIPEGQESSNPDRRGKILNFDHIKEKITQSTQNTTPGAMSFSMFPEKKFNLRPGGPNQSEQRQLYGGEHHDLPISVFGKEIIKKSGEDSSNDAKSKVVYYSYEELGRKLKQLRPEEAKGINKSFSLDELNKRLIKLRELDRIRPPRSGGPFDIVRDSIAKMGKKETSEKSMIYNPEALANMGIPVYMKKPPKEHLVEKYFHPDNMSSAEKMKLELKRVRDEFKMSESDCGSSRVQVAMLTTKIKHLSTALHKKDKHSRKGLQAMVQKRKKLLKYMRRTDWDSYCLVLSKLGLRDNPDYKN